MKPPRDRFVMLAGALFLVACKGPSPDALPVASAAPSTPAAPSAAPALASALASAEPAEHHHEMNLPPVGSTVTVTLDGKTKDVTLSLVAGDGGVSVPLLAVFRRAWPAEDPSRLHFDLVGSDGFRPMSRAKCTHLLASDEAAHIRLNVASHDAVLDEGLNLPGCYHVHAVVTIEATRNGG